MKKLLLTCATATTLLFGALHAHASEYIIDTKGAHASINFKVKHLGYSWLTGRFNNFSGSFNYDANNVNASNINVEVDMSSLDSNHAKRDKHVRSDDYLDVDSFGSASFVSTSIKETGNNTLEVVGDLTLMGVTKSMTFAAEKIGEGKDPWGGYRAGFSATGSFSSAEFGLPDHVGEVVLDLHIEGIRQ